MADNGGGQSFIGFILGGVVVVMIIMGIFLYSGGHLGSGKTTVINVPSAPSTTK
jgi:hypothetical protein